MAVILPAWPASIALAGADHADVQLVDVGVADRRRARSLDRQVERQALDLVDRQRARAVEPGGAEIVGAEADLDRPGVACPDSRPTTTRCRARRACCRARRSPRGRVAAGEPLARANGATPVAQRDLERPVDPDLLEAGDAEIAGRGFGGRSKTCAAIAAAMRKVRMTRTFLHHG